MSLMRVEKVPDATYDMVGGLDKQIKEIKEVSLVWQSNFEVNIQSPGYRITDQAS